MSACKGTPVRVSAAGWAVAFLNELLIMAPYLFSLLALSVFHLIAAGTVPPDDISALAFLLFVILRGTQGGR